LHGNIFALKYIVRKIETEILESLEHNPVTAILGPRQCGKSTLAKNLIKGQKEAVYLDLERPSDLQKLENGEWYLSTQRDKLICIDEIQRKPELFPLIRSLVDEWEGAGNFLVLGSSSRELLKQSSESLAGRISYKQLTPFLFTEVKEIVNLERFIQCGGFPRSILSPDTKKSFGWRSDFISTFLERDLLQWAGFYPITMRRLWHMLAHNNGQTVNYSALGSSLSVSNVTIRNYIDLLEGTFMVDVLPPYFSNLKKRLIKAPRVYIADSGITSALLGLTSFEQLSGHPAMGAIWEQMVLTHLKAHFRNADFSYYRTSNGAEVDIVMTYQGHVFAFECKASRSPVLTNGSFLAIEDINPIASFVVAPVESSWSMKKNLEVVSLHEVVTKIESK
jgi:predicted AAA+ superfamily ATPase